MANGRIEIKNNFQGETGYVIARWYKTTAPLVAAPGYVTDNGTVVGTVTQLVYPAPHDQRSLLIEQLDPVMYLVRFYRSADGSSIDQEILTLAVDAKSGAIFPVYRYTYIVDGPGDYDPVSGQNELRDPRLLDQLYWIEERGTGTLREDEITDRSDDGGGFDFAEDGKVFESERTYFAEVIERVEAGDSGSAPVAEALPGVVLLQGATGGVSDDFDFDTMAGKLLLTDYPGIRGALNFGTLETIADHKSTINTHGGEQAYFVIRLSGGDTVNYMNQQVNAIYLPKGETLTYMIKDGAMRILEYSGNYTRRGSVFIDNCATRAALIGNLLLADEATGVLNSLDYPGIWDFIPNLGAGEVVALTSWGTATVINAGKINQATVYLNKAKWGVDNIAGTFRVPHLADLTPRLDTVGAAGAYQHDQVGSFEGDLTLNRGNGYTGGGPNARIGYGANSPLANSNGNVIMNTGNSATRVKSFTQKPYIVL